MDIFIITDKDLEGVGPVYASTSFEKASAFWAKISEGFRDRYMMTQIELHGETDDL